METVWQFALLFGVGIVAGFMNVTAGGGSSLGLPALIFLGLDPSVANGTNRIAIIVQNISAVSSFRSSGMRGLRQSLWLSAWAVPGAILGTVVAVRISDAWFQIAVGIVNILTIVTMFLPKSKAADGTDDDPKRKLLVGVTLFFVGIYGGFIQLSVGFLLMATLYRLSRMNLVLVNMHKVTIAMVYNIPSLAIFWWTGNVQFLPGLVLGLGSAVGGWTSAKVQIRKGEGFIKFVLAIALVMISLKLFGAW